MHPTNHPLSRLLVEECCGFYVDLEAGERQLYRALRAGLPPATQSNHIQCKSPRFDSSTQYHQFESGLRFSTWLTVLCTTSNATLKNIKLSGDFVSNRTRFGIFDLFLSCRALHCCFTQNFLLFNAKLPAVCRSVVHFHTAVHSL